uniref:Antimicrobial peptide n=1 Tax=Euperipatoides rowelli TaxID=49087 RepID=D9IX79_EUPRO|nr:antimicrobial peptide [Euperipatoides rowelli]
MKLLFFICLITFCVAAYADDLVCDWMKRTITIPCKMHEIYDHDKFCDSIEKMRHQPATCDDVYNFTKNDCDTNHPGNSDYVYCADD